MPINPPAKSVVAEAPANRRNAPAARHLLIRESWVRILPALQTLCVVTPARAKGARVLGGEMDLPRL